MEEYFASEVAQSQQKSHDNASKNDAAAGNGSRNQFGIRPYPELPDLLGAPCEEEKKQDNRGVSPPSVDQQKVPPARSSMQEHMLTTMVSSSRQFLDAKITEVVHVRESMFKASVAYYCLQTKSTLLSLYNKDRVYEVRRRFNDFKRLYSALKQVDEYKGFSIPPLPEDATDLTSYVIHSDTFIKERR